MSLTEKKRQFKTIGFLILLSISLTFPLIQNNFDISYEQNRDTDFVKTSAQRSVTQQWIRNSDFSTQDDWDWENGTQGDNSDMNAIISSDQANYEVLGEKKSFSVTSGTVNSSSWYGWGIYNNSDFLLPDATAINESGCYTNHILDEITGPGQVHNFPSVHFKKNVSMPDDMSDYIITDVSLEVIFNASVDINVDSFYDWDNTTNTAYIDADKFEIGDSANFYTELSDLNNSYPFRVANFETRDVALGQGDRGHEEVLNITNTELNYVDKLDLIANLNTALEGDQKNFAITLGLDIYCEDNKAGGGGDQDYWDYLIFKSVNLTITYVKKIDEFTTLSWNQEGNKLDSGSVQVTDAKFFFKYKMNITWPSSAQLSEIIFYINDKSYDEGIIKLTNFTNSWQDAKVGGFDVTSLISMDVIITVSIEVFLKDDFELGHGISISIDEVYLNISYIETFPDYGTDLELFLDGDDKTLDPVIQIPIKNLLNITVTYKENVSGTHISADSATLEGKVSGVLNETSNHYYFIVNSTELGLGISVLTVTLQKVNYETKYIQIFVEVFERETTLQLLVDGFQKSNNATIDVKFNEFLNFTVLYEDDLMNSFIDTASVELLGFGNMDETLNQYNLTLNTNNLSQGVNVLTIFAQKSNYQSQTIQIYVNVVERATQLMFFINSSQYYDGNTFHSQYDESLNITINYTDDLTTLHIDGASVDLLGFGTMEEGLDQYSLTLNTNNLTRGVNVLTIFAQKGTYQSQTIQFFININIRTTNATVYVEGDLIEGGDTINSQFDVILDVTVFYRDYETDSHLIGAGVELLGLGDFDEIGTQFNFTIQTNNLTKGINVLTIFCQFDGYEAQTIQFFINVDERDTELILFINGIQKNQSDTTSIQFEVNELINITVFYKDNLTDTHLNGANVELLDVNNLEELGSQFNITINSNNLTKDINIFTVFAQLLNYKPQSIQFVIEVVDRATQIQLFLNGVDKTADPVLELAIGTLINITLKYYDNRTGLEIPSALVQLFGALDDILTEDLNQYSIVLNSSHLSLDDNSFTIVAQASTYQINTVHISIIVNRVRAEIDTVSDVPVINPGDNFLLKIVLNNTDFGGTIKNATVTYRWDNGQGILTDSNNDGIYEATLYNVPAGVYFISINAYAGENYDFNDIEITLNVEVPSGDDITVIIISLAAGVVGLSVSFVLYQTHFKFPPKVRMVRKVRKKIIKGKKLKPLTVNTRDNIITSELERNKGMFSIEKENVNKGSKKTGGNSLD